MRYRQVENPLFFLFWRLPWVTLLCERCCQRDVTWPAVSPPSTSSPASLSSPAAASARVSAGRSPSPASQSAPSSADTRHSRPSSCSAPVRRASRGWSSSAGALSPPEGASSSCSLSSCCDVRTRTFLCWGQLQIACKYISHFELSFDLPGCQVTPLHNQ